MPLGSGPQVPWRVCKGDGVPFGLDDGDDVTTARRQNSAFGPTMTESSLLTLWSINSHEEAEISPPSRQRKPAAADSLFSALSSSNP